MISKKILFITLSNIGDAVMTLPTLEFLNQKYPGSKFDLVCDERSFEIFKYIPYVNKIYLKDKKKGLYGNLILINELRKKNYDIAVDLRTDFYPYLLKAKEKFYKVKDNSIHSVFKHFMSVEKDLKKIPKCKVFIPKEILKKTNNFFKNPNLKTVSIALGANSSFKIWPTKKYIQLLNSLQKKFDYVFLIGDQRDFLKAEYFSKNYANKSINLCGSLSLIETAAIIKHSDFFIGNDSGLGHIASAFDTPCFVIFGEGDPVRYRPWGERSHWFQNKSKDINKISVNTIYSKLIKIII